ncbi:MAG: hypothetical protein Unbinned5213contig1001_15 [Prokaryotic dsDNA virus sp.]|nr:MAG: hypothetical protein Unbinned5213contig1001_15 [Prokaryotic dsDNA virus sp.]|tara:strand:+ start:20770 stop:20976 length:207 start_codon:yes stop_codon:yes gene_type:complete
MTRQEKQGLIENLVSLIESIKENTTTYTDPQKTIVETLTKVYSQNTHNKTKLDYIVKKLNELKLNLNK